MAIAHLNIGSNQGDRRANIARAVALLSGQFTIIGVSDPVESDPVGFLSPHRFVNVGVSVATELDPLPLLDAIQAIERRCGHLPHRNTDGSYRDRDIDIDIILYDDLRLSSPRLTLPHPRMAERPFVLGPLRQLHPEIADKLYDKRMECARK